LDRDNNCVNTTYKIRVKGIPAKKYSSWFDEFNLISQQNDETLMIVSITDQAALHGLLARIRNLRLSLISVESVSPREY